MRISDWSSDVCSSDLHASKACQVLRQYRVALVWHGAGAFLPRREIFFCLQNFRALQVPDFHGEALYGRRADERRVGKECVSPCRSRWSPYTKNKKHKIATSEATTTP